LWQSTRAQATGRAAQTIREQRPSPFEKLLPSAEVLSTWTVYDSEVGLAPDDDRRTRIFNMGGIEHLLVAGMNVSREGRVVLHLALLRRPTAAADVEGGVRGKMTNAARRNGDVDPHTTRIVTKKTIVAVDMEDMETHLQKVVKISGKSIAIDEDEVQRHPLPATSRLGLLELSVRKTKDPVARTTTNRNEAHHPAMMTPKGTSAEAQVPRSPIDTGLFGTLVSVPLVEWSNA
jgi:hypothetical protein